jgi:hypothetical protein
MNTGTRVPALSATVTLSGPEGQRPPIVPSSKPNTLLPVTTSAAATEPPSFADRLADLRCLQQRVATATRVLLTGHGWHYTCLNPAQTWLWSKKLPDGRTIFTDLSTALAIEASLAGHPLPAAASAATWESRACETKPASPQQPHQAAGTSAQ